MRHNIFLAMLNYPLISNNKENLSLLRFNFKSNMVNMIMIKKKIIRAITSFYS